MNITNKLIRFNIFISIVLIASGVLYYINIDSFNKNKLILGQWTGSSEEIQMKVTINSNNQCIFLTKNISTGKISNIDGLCSFDYSKQPYPLDVKDLNKGNLYTIINFINLDTIQIARFSKVWRLRPIAFNKYDLILKRTGK